MTKERCVEENLIKAEWQFEAMWEGFLAQSARRGTNPDEVLHNLSEVTARIWVNIVRVQLGLK